MTKNQWLQMAGFALVLIIAVMAILWINGVATNITSKTGFMAVVSLIIVWMLESDPKKR